MDFGRLFVSTQVASMGATMAENLLEDLLRKIEQNVEEEVGKAQLVMPKAENVKLDYSLFRCFNYHPSFSIARSVSLFNHLSCFRSTIASPS